MQLLISASSLISAYNSNENLVKTDTSNTSMQQIDVKVSNIDVKLNSINKDVKNLEGDLINYKIIMEELITNLCDNIEDALFNDSKSLRSSDITTLSRLEYSDGLSVGTRARISQVLTRVKRYGKVSSIYNEKDEKRDKQQELKYK
ncbi:MAG: hypothetical protein ACRC7W_02435 [Fusobacteriaceae bacterium]